MLEELLMLAKESLSRIPSEAAAGEAYVPYFRQVAFFLLQLLELSEKRSKKDPDTWELSEWEAVNEMLYADIAGDHYAQSWANPSYAGERVAKEWAGFLPFVYMQMRSCIGDVYENDTERLLDHIQYFLGLYHSFCEAAEEGKEPSYQVASDDLADFMFYLLEKQSAHTVAAKVDPDRDFAYRIIMESDFSDPAYLYRYGEYISDNQIHTAAYLMSLPKETLKKMADAFTEGYRIGFIKTGKDLSIKSSVQLVYPIGFEPIIKLAIANFKEMHLRPIIPRDASCVTEKRYGLTNGFFGEIPNKQCEYDHREDKALYLNHTLCERRLQMLTKSFEEKKQLARAVGGPAVIEIFGEAPFTLKSCKFQAEYSEKQRDLLVEYTGLQSKMQNEYIPGEERSYTVISFPVPEVGERYPEIMRETIRLNTLDYQMYERIQQIMIDALDTCRYVEIKGQGDNRTDLTVNLYTLTDPAKQTIFENCVADVNIPVGEIFTSPVLAGTNGLLHVTKVFLNGVEYRNLKLWVKDGRVTDYACSNFEDPGEGRKLIENQILHHHKSIAIGEFAIGTNTTAYRMAKDFGIEDRMQILIAEKTGPHIAFGDTCYSHEEEVVTYNPDGKAIVARDNEVSMQRNSEDEEKARKAYYNCHTDVTLPYDELGGLWGVKENGERIAILEQGRFVLEGTQALNEPLDA
ncbi:MAG: aminopeptidase [Lachnospiraceae bacterium]|nr:aminopeptidase [Lachnospiraceae bacterium]